MGRPPRIANALLVKFQAAYEALDNLQRLGVSSREKKEKIKAVLISVGVEFNAALEEDLVYYINTRNQLYPHQTTRCLEDPELKKEFDLAKEQITNLFSEPQRAAETEILSVSAPSTIESTSTALAIKPDLPLSQDLVRGRYVTADINRVWTADETIRDDACVTAIMDLGSKKVIAYIVTPTNLTSEVFKELLTHAFEITQTKPLIFHSDGGAPFISNTTRDFLRENGIEQSIGGTSYNTHFANQVHESMHKTLWGLLDCWKTNKEGLQHWTCLDFKQKEKLIGQAFELINSKVVGKRFSPRQVFEALTESEVPKPFGGLVDQKSPVAKAIQNFKQWATEQHYATIASEESKLCEAEILDDYASTPFDGQLTQNLMGKAVADISKAVRVHSNKTNQLIEANFKESEKRLKLEAEESLKRYNTIKEELTELKAQNAIIVKAQLEKEAKAKAKELAKRLRIKRVPRDPVLPEYMGKILESVSPRKNRLAQAQDRVALTFMFLTGLRVSNLLNISHSHLKDFFIEKRSIAVRLIKSDANSMFSFHYVSEMRPFVKAVEADVKLLLDNVRNLATPNMNQPVWGQARTNFWRRIKFIMARASEALGKNLSSHSFRIGLITRLVAASDLFTAQQIVGHAKIGTTALYARNQLTKGASEEVLKRAWDKNLRVDLDNPAIQQVMREEQEREETEELEENGVDAKGEVLGEGAAPKGAAKSDTAESEANVAFKRKRIRKRKVIPKFKVELETLLKRAIDAKKPKGLKVLKRSQSSLRAKREAQRASSNKSNEPSETNK
jgi:site-specific recombinase XerD